MHVTEPYGQWATRGKAPMSSNLRGLLVMCAVAVEACGFGALDGLQGGDTQSGDDGGTGIDPTGMAGAGGDIVADSNGAGGSTAGTGGGGTGGAAGSVDAADAPESGGRDGGTNDAIAGKILLLTVYDTINAASWAIMTNFQIGPSAPDIWLDWPNSYVDSIDLGAQPLVGKEWIRTYSQSKLYVGTNPAAEAKITLNGTANVYLIVDDRATTSVNPPITGWIDTTYNLRIWENATHSFPFSIWVKRNQTGEVYLPIQNYNNAYNYFAIVE